MVVYEDDYEDDYDYDYENVDVVVNVNVNVNVDVDVDVDVVELSPPTSSLVTSGVQRATCGRWSALREASTTVGVGPTGTGVHPIHV